ncbi:MAG: PH domain-containing protein [Gemmatimonadetes bacterium]|nr:PH domain-containing protein [Gemmatimonadota bacterium]MYB98696.1 PH domain-containing protein [Gemmatimonadota bacterium]
MTEQRQTTLFDGMYVGGAVRIGTSAERYRDFLLEGEEVRMEFKGARDALVFTDLRMIVLDPQGIRGKKVAVISVPWKSITAFSLENSGRLDLDAELKVSGCGFGICELSFAKGTDVSAVNAFLAGRILGGA